MENPARDSRPCQRHCLLTIVPIGNGPSPRPAGTQSGHCEAPPGSMPPCSPSQPLARLGGQFFQLLGRKKGPASRLQPWGGAGRGRAGLEKSAPSPVPSSQSSENDPPSLELLLLPSMETYWLGSQDTPTEPLTSQVALGKSSPFSNMNSLL